MAKRWNKRILLAKVETSYGTDAAPTGAADAVLCRDLELGVEAELLDRELVRPTLGDLPALSALRRATVDCEVELAGSGAAGTAPAWGTLLRGCGLAETVTAGVKVQYDPASSNHDSLTLYWYADGLVHKLVGCRGTVSLSLEAGQIPTMRFRFTGLYQDPTDEALPSADVSAWKTPAVPSKAATPTFTLHGVTAIARSLGLDLANQVTFRDMIGASDVNIVDRSVTGSAVIEAVPVATKNWHSLAAAGTLGALSVVHGTQAGQIVELSASAVQIRDVRYEEQDGIIYHALDLGFTETSGDDEIALIAR